MEDLKVTVFFYESRTKSKVVFNAIVNVTKESKITEVANIDSESLEDLLKKIIREIQGVYEDNKRED